MTYPYAAALAGAVHLDIEEERPQPLFGDLDLWVGEHFIPMYRRTLGGEFRWCAEWWRHAEAVSRLTSLWHSWEAMRLQPATGIGLWYRDHLDHQLPVLLGPRGPFYQCTETEHLEPHRFHTIPIPPGHFETDDDLLIGGGQ